MISKDRQSRKRLLTRQRISDAATGLFFQHGFDRVTIDQIAEAADVSRMTVFNHFARKEDMFFDLDQEARAILFGALREKDQRIAPVEALRLFAHRAVAEQFVWVQFFQPDSGRFMNTVRGSDALKARARAIRDELTEELTQELATAAGRPLPDPDASLAAALLLATWTVALLEGFRIYEHSGNVATAKQTFLRLIDQGSHGVQSALTGTPYA